MFVFTMKFNKKVAILTILAAAVLLAAIVLIISSGREDSNPVKLGLGLGVKSEADRLNYLYELGWECEAEPVEEQSIVIPRVFSSVFEEYNDLQKQQGFDLSEYKGLECEMYRYRVNNYPSGEGNVIAQIIVLNYQVIGGDIHSSALDGFMHGLK